MNGIRSSPASSIVSSRRAGTLSGEAQCGPPFADEPVGGRLEHDPHRGGDRPQRVELVAASSRPGSGAAAGRSRRARASRRGPRYSSVVSQPSAAQLVARDPVAELRLVAEREERLACSRPRRRRARSRAPRPRQVRPLAAARRPRERAVAADVAAERRQRDEDLRRVGDEPAAPAPLRAAASSSSSGAASRSRHRQLIRRYLRVAPEPAEARPAPLRPALQQRLLDREALGRASS